MNDDDLIRDMEQARRRLEDSLKVCRKIISSYRSSLTKIAGNRDDGGFRLFEWQDAASETQSPADASVIESASADSGASETDPGGFQGGAAPRSTSGS